MGENKLEVLGEKLKTIIDNREDPFTKIKVIVPSYSLKAWANAYWLKNTNNVLMNVSFYTIDEFFTSSFDSVYKLLTKDIVKLFIINELTLEHDKYKSLNQYYYNSDNIDYNKLYDLANMLGDLYIEYEDDCVDYSNSLSVYKDDEEKLFKKVDEIAESNKYKSRLKFIEKENLKNNCDIIVFFGFNKYTNLEEKLIKKLNISCDSNLKIEKCDDIADLKIITAPSKIREIEGIHTEICNILLDKNNTYSDVLVLAPKISDYKTIIRQIFHQDNKEYPSLTRSVNNEGDIQTDLTLVLIKLKEICKKEFYSALDFVDLLSNSLIKKNRGLSDDDIDIIKDVLVKLNIKRENTKSNTIKDFTYLKTRLLMNQILDVNILDNNTIEIADKKYIPFDSIGLTNEIITAIVDTIDSINSIIEFYKNNNLISSSNIDLFVEELSKWFSNLDSECGEKNSDYKNLLNKVEEYKNVVASDLSIDVLLNYLIDVSLSKRGNNDNYFLKGITFANFDKNALLSSKYIFLIGCESNSLNSDLLISELDLREHKVLKEKYKEELENAFLTQSSFATEKVFISYVNEDLKKEKEIYPSDLIDDVVDAKEKVKTLEDYKVRYKNTIEKYEEMPLDETRSNSELFTKREDINKNYYNELRGIVSNNSNVQETENYQCDSVDNTKIIEVKLNELRDFLNEPYSFWITKLFGKEDETNDKLNNKFEPFEVDNLTSYSIVKDMFLEKYNSGNINKVKEKYTLENKIPIITNEIKKIALEGQEKKEKNVFEKRKDYIVKQFDDLLIDDKYLIKISNMILIKENIDDNLTYFALLKENDDKFKDYIELYLNSLVYVLNEGNNGLYSIKLEASFKTELPKKFEIYFDTAKEHLINIINMMFESIKDLKYFKYDDVKEKKGEFIYSKDLFGENGSWKYFQFKDLFDKYKLPGFSDKKDREETIDEYKKFYEANIGGDKNE